MLLRKSFKSVSFSLKSWKFNATEEESIVMPPAGISRRQVAIMRERERQIRVYRRRRDEAILLLTGVL